MRMTTRLGLLLCCMIATVPLLAHGKWFIELPSVARLVDHDNVDLTPAGVENWFRHHYRHANPKLTRLHFFLHENVTAPNPTAIRIAPGKGSVGSSMNFGDSYVMDDPVTGGSDPDSEMIGRAQGTYTFVSRAELVLSMEFTLVFGEGRYEGSTLTFQGNNGISHKYREVSVVCGTGVFRMASGIATVETYTMDMGKQNDILEFTVIVEHY